MFKKIKCNKCNDYYDEAFDECPHCHAKNTEQDPELKNVQVLSMAKQIGIFLVGFAGLELFSIIISLIITKTAMATWDEALLNMLLNTLVYALIFVSQIAIINKSWTKIFKSFKNWKPFVYGVICLFSILLFTFLYRLILIICKAPIDVNQNQGAIDETASPYPFTALIVFGILGPICEELTYRVGLFTFLKRISKWLAYPVTVLMFALIHARFSPDTWLNELLNLPIYLFAGFALTYTYDKFGFAGSLTAHLLNNVLSLIPFAIATGVFY